jgi:glucose-6-phosphate dehydrogenase assembly protein OpcA
VADAGWAADHLGVEPVGRKSLPQIYADFHRFLGRKIYEVAEAGWAANYLGVEPVGRKS